MEKMNERLSLFFDEYARRFNEALQGKPADAEATAESFASCFVEASPLGISCAQNDRKFREAIPKGYEFYKSIGTKSMEIASRHIAILDPYHAMVRVHWDSNYEKEGNPVNIQFDVIYFLQTIDENPKIFAYITGDEQKVLKERGLIPQEMNTQ